MSSSSAIVADAFEFENEADDAFSHFELANVEDELTDLTFDLDVPPAVAGNEPKGLVCVLGFLWMSARERLVVSRLSSWQDM